MTIRNVTVAPLELKLIERFERPKARKQDDDKNKKKRNPFSALVGNVTELIDDAGDLIDDATDGLEPARPGRPPLSPDAKSFVRQTVALAVPPFDTRSVGIGAVTRRPGEILRLTVEREGRTYWLEVPPPRDASAEFEFVPMAGAGAGAGGAPAPGQQQPPLTGVFIPAHSFVAVFSSARPNAWMARLRDETALSLLSIPGTHNTPAYHRALPSVRCQAVSARVQLENGVRFLDVRVQVQTGSGPEADRLQLVHGAFPVSLSGAKLFRPLVDETLAFLTRNPSETVIMSVKREGVGEGSDQLLSRLLRDHHTARDRSRWYTDPNVPTLGQARGKIVLLRRFALDDGIHREENGGRGFGLDGHGWADNTGNDLHGPLAVQDFYDLREPVSFAKKITLVNEHLARAAAVPVPAAAPAPSLSPPFHLNFLSASNFWKPDFWPEKIAAKANPGVVEHLCMRHATDAGPGHSGSTGILVCDFVGKHGDWDLVRCIVGWNSRLEAWEKGIR